MAIVAGDLLFKLSIKTGSAGNSATQPDPNQSLGKYISTTTLSGTALNNLFDDISGAENAASTVDYRCVFVHNNHGSLPLTSAVVYVTSEVAGGASVAIAIDNVAASAIGSASAQADQIANETTAPSAVGAFSTPTTAGTGLSLGTIAAGSTRAFWVRRTAANTSAVNADGATWNVTGDTAA
jgi:hypothetical protein